MEPNTRHIVPNGNGNHQTLILLQLVEGKFNHLRISEKPGCGIQGCGAGIELTFHP